MITTSSLPSLPANHYIPVKQGDPGFEITATDANASDVMTWRLISSPGFKLVAGANQYSKFLLSDAGFVPKTTGSFSVTVGVSDGHNPEVTKVLSIPVVADSIPVLNSTPYTETVSGVNFFNTAKNKWDVTVPGTESPALRFPITDPATARQRFYPGGVSWVTLAPYAANYSVGETFTGPTAAEVGTYDNAFSNYSAYPAGFLGALTDEGKASYGWNARTLFNDSEGDKVLYRLQGGSVFVAGTYGNTIGQTFTLTGVDGATATTIPVLGNAARTDEYPKVNAGNGTIEWRPILFEMPVTLPTGFDNVGNPFPWTTPANWSFTVEALEKVYNPLGTGNAPGDINYDLISSQKGVQNYTVKVQPNSRPKVGPLVTIPGGTNPVPGAFVNMVYNPSTTLVIGGGASLNPLSYGRPGIQEPESRRYDIGAGTGFDYTQKNTVLPAVWRWLIARAGGNATIAADVQIYDPDRTGNPGHQDTVVASMNPLLSSGIPGDPLPGDTSNNVPVLDPTSKFYYNPWITAGDAGAFQVNWGPNRNQYLLARVAGTMNLTLPVDVRDQYQRQAGASARINPIFGTVRITNHRQRGLRDSATEATTGQIALGNYEPYNNPLTLTNDGVGHYGDNTVGGPGTHSAALFTYLPFPSTDAVDETNFGATAPTATHLMDGTGPASGVIGSGPSALYTAASWITLYSTEAPRTGFHTGNPLNDETTKFNFTSYASALQGSDTTSSRIDWKTFGYTFVNGSNPTAPIEEQRFAVGSNTNHEYRAQVIPSNSPYLWGRTSFYAATGYTAQGMGWSGNINEATRRFGQGWFSQANPMGFWGPNGYIYGLYQGEIDAQSSRPGRQNGQSSLNTTTLRWAYSWPTQITNVNFQDTTAVGNVNKWKRGDVMEIAVPNMGINSRFFFTGDGSQNDSLASTIFGWGGTGMTSTAGIVDSETVFGTGTLGATGYTIADNTPFHVPSNSIWVPNNRGGLFVTQHLNLPNRTTFSPGATATELSFTGRKGYMDTALATNVLVDPSYKFQDIAATGFDNSYPGLVSLTAGDSAYYLWLKQDVDYSTAWGTWDASKLTSGSTYTATGGLTTVPNFAMTNGATTSTYPSLFSGAQVSLANGALPGQNHASNIDVSTDPALYNSNIISPVGWARSQWGLLAPTVGFQPWSVPTNNVRLVNPKFDSTDVTTFNNTVASFRNLGGVGFVSTDGGFRDSATVYAIRKYTDEHGNPNAETGLAGVMPGSPLLAQWYNLQLAGDPTLNGSMVIATALDDVTSKTWPKVFTFYSPFFGDPAWTNVMEFKMNFLVGMTYPNAAPNTLVKVPATVASLFTLGAPVTDPSCTNPGNTINPGNPIVRSIQTFQINDYKANNTTSSRVLSTMDLSNSNPTNPVTGAGSIVTAGSNSWIQALSNVTLKWQASVNNQVLPSGYYVELFRLTSANGVDADQPILLATFRTGHIGGKDAVQVMHLPSMHSFSGLTGVAGPATEAVYFFKVRTLWFSGIQMEKTPLKMSTPMAYADYVSSPFVTQ